MENLIGGGGAADADSSMLMPLLLCISLMQPNVLAQIKCGDWHKNEH